MADIPDWQVALPFAVFNGFCSEDGYPIYGDRIDELGLRCRLNRELLVLSHDILYDLYKLKFAPEPAPGDDGV